MLNPFSPLISDLFHLNADFVKKLPLCGPLMGTMLHITTQFHVRVDDFTKNAVAAA
jgi:hypothetical protein